MRSGVRAAARRPVSSFRILEVVNAELVSRDIPSSAASQGGALPSCSSGMKEGGGLMNGWFSLIMMQRDEGRKEWVRYGWFMTGRGCIDG